MEYLLIVYGSSSAYLYVQEAWLRGMKPIILYPPTYAEVDIGAFRNRVGEEAEYMFMKEEPETDTVVESLKAYNIKCVVAGSEAGVRYADRVASILGMPCNDPETIWRRNTKKGMHQSLKEAGIRYIKSLAVKNEDDIRTFWKENGLKKGMIKHSESASSIGNKVVFSAEEAIAHYRFLKDMPNEFGIETEVILQEFIEGEEYIVDSVSCKGKHMITDVWKYHKVLTKNNDVVYEATYLITNLDGEMYDLVKYALRVLTATGFEYGACHGEYKIDEKGPVLIETNARPFGMSMKREYLDEIVGHHISDISVDSYLDPERFEQHRLKPYRPLKHATIKLFISPVEADVDLMPLDVIMGEMKSIRHTTVIHEGKVHVPMTIDLSTSPVAVKMCHEDKEVLDSEVELLRTIERYPEISYEYETESKTIPVTTNWKEMFEYITRERKTLVVTNDERRCIWFGKNEKIDAKWDSYDDLIYAYTAGKKLSEIYRKFLEEAAKVRDGGKIIIVSEFLEKLPYGAICAQVLLQISGCKLDMPIVGFEKYMIATKYGK